MKAKSLIGFVLRRGSAAPESSGEWRSRVSNNDLRPSRSRRLSARPSRSIACSPLVWGKHSLTCVRRSPSLSPPLDLPVRPLARTYWKRASPLGGEIRTSDDGWRRGPSPYISPTPDTSHSLSFHFSLPPFTFHRPRSRELSRWKVWFTPCTFAVFRNSKLFADSE